MKLASVLASLALYGTSFGYVIHIYSTENCEGEPMESELNVWDTSCSSEHQNFRSFMPKYYGGEHQKASFYYSSHCNDLSPNNPITRFWADGGDENFQINQCTNLEFPAHAAGSAAI